MNIFKRTVLLALTIVMAMSILVIPAFAAEPLDSEWRTVFAGFPTQTIGSNSAYTGAIQSFLYASSTTRQDIVNAGGIDGKYGSGTASAVATFQGEYNRDFGASIGTDGSVGPKTWPAIASYLCKSSVGTYYNWSRYDETEGNYNICMRYKYNETSSVWKIGYYKENGTIGGEFTP